MTPMAAPFTPLSLSCRALASALMLALLCLGSPLGAQTAPAGSGPEGPPASDVRALEVIATSEGFRSGPELVDLSAVVQTGRFSHVFPEGRTITGVAYRSEIEPMLPLVTDTFPNPLLDLDQVLGRETLLMPIMETMGAHNALLGTTPRPESPLGRAPGLTNLNSRAERIGPGNMLYLDPGNPSTREYLLAVFLEMTSATRADGLILRGFEYPGPDWGYSADALLSFRASVGGRGAPPPDDPTFRAWRRQQLTETLRYLRIRLRERNPAFRIGVLIEAEGTPPATWEEWLASDDYANRYQDWIQWCREGLVDDLVVRIHRRHTQDGRPAFEDWLRFINDNCANANPIISVSGPDNFTADLNTQIRAVRSRGLGILLHHYALPSRDKSAGFYSALPTTAFGAGISRRLEQRPLVGNLEPRVFTQMSSPPATIEMIQRTPAPSPTPRLRLSISTPTPVPSRTPEPVFRPDNLVREITLISGRVLKGQIVEVRRREIVFKPEGSTREVLLQRVNIRSINPPLEPGM